MWRMQSEPMLIDLSNNFFFVKHYRREEYERTLLDDPWMIGDHYLHVQEWKPNFRAEKEEISTLQCGLDSLCYRWSTTLRDG